MTQTEALALVGATVAETAMTTIEILIGATIVVAILITVLWWMKALKK